jgi:hypothetical protein
MLTMIRLVHAHARKLGPLLGLVGSTTVAGHLSAQEPTDSVRAEVARLGALVDSLHREVAGLRAASEREEESDALARLRTAAQGAAARGTAEEVEPAEQAFVGRQRSLQALNPEISLNADLFGFVNPDDWDQNNFVPREFELSLQSSLDPFSRAKIFISRHAAGPEIIPFAESDHEHEGEEEGHGSGFAVEEGYVEWVSLPGGVGLKLGRFQQRFGTMNRWHSHALPFQGRSLPHLAYLGEEALAQTGLSMTWLAPVGGGAAGTYETTIELTRSENELFGESARPSMLGHVNGFWHFGPSTDLELGLSWLAGWHGEADSFFRRDVYNIEFAFNWSPPERSRQRGLVVRGGVMVLEGLLPHEEDLGPPDPGARAMGLWSMAELRLSPSWLVGLRLDRAESPHEPDETQTLFSPTLTWWQSEFVRVRAEYDRLGGFEGSGSTGLFALQVTFAMGPHKHETY